MIDIRRDHYGPGDGWQCFHCAHYWAQLLWL